MHLYVLEATLEAGGTYTLCASELGAIPRELKLVPNPVVGVLVHDFEGHQSINPIRPIEWRKVGSFPWKLGG